MVNVLNPEDCCGCTACASICNFNAISMLPDSLGFLYPKVDTSKCTNCGLCEKVCDFTDNYEKAFNLSQPIAYGARHKDIKEVETSRSGAAFIAFSDYILENNGIIYGVGYKGHFIVSHKKACIKEERDEFKGSKYVQSDLTGIFKDIKQELRNGRKVLFTGTPCQTSGLRKFLGKNLLENLFLIDIVCHGVSSPYLWKDYLTNIERTYNDFIVNVNFRDKQKYGWACHRESFILKNKKEKIYPRTVFYNNIYFRYSCYNCHFSNLIRPSDITIADFWGWEKTNPTFNVDNKGVNLILINTDKGKKLFEETQSKMEVFNVKVEDALQPNLQAPTNIHPLRGRFEKDYSIYGFHYVNRKYLKNTSSKLEFLKIFRRIILKVFGL